MACLIMQYLYMITDETNSDEVGGAYIGPCL